MSEPLYRFPKNALEEVHVSLTTFKGRRYVDIRVFYQPTDGSEPRPTKKGICLAVADLDELKQALAKVEAVLKPGGRGK